jgi:hypothetical protein
MTPVLLYRESILKIFCNILGLQNQPLPTLSPPDIPQNPGGTLKPLRGLGPKPLGPLPPVMGILINHARAAQTRAG